MKQLSLLFVVLLVSACGSSDSGSNTAVETITAVQIEAPADPNEGSHRYRYVESIAHPENDCSTSSEVGDELTQETTFTDSLVTVIFIGDDLPEGAEPGRREFDEQLDDHMWREIQETSNGSILEHTVEFTDSAFIMTTLRDGHPCFYSVRERIDA